MAAVALPGKLCGRSAILRPIVNSKMRHVRIGKPRQRALDRRQRADAAIEHEQSAASKPHDARRDLLDQVLEDGRGQADAAGIVDKGRIVAVRYSGPDQRIETIGDARRQPFGLHTVGIHRQMKAVFLGGRTNGQNGDSTLRKAPCYLVPGQAFDEMVGGIARHAPDFQSSAFSGFGGDTR
jgi:hypothetical protein